MSIKIPIEFEDQEGLAEIAAATDRVVVSCDLIGIEIPGRGDLTIVIDAELRETPVGKALQNLWDVINEQEK